MPDFALVIQPCNKCRVSFIIPSHPGFLIESDSWLIWFIKKEISFVNLEDLALCTANQTDQGKDPWSVLQHVEFESSLYYDYQIKVAIGQKNFNTIIVYTLAYVSLCFGALPFLMIFQMNPSILGLN